ncbi:hypothetical protein [Pseudomonas phage Achelous]|uniref:Uncharacterized protein n=1 Tax=Pseudomonas phage Achelous TaxID=2163982 RepID=A0A2S1GMV7_9CAUD|nr:hypothetical protein HOT10_gp06 [Pseudomonas phage Achelous]AWD90683.1 hypothetical protein [Pseudomonas phage Achelous]
MGDDFDYQAVSYHDETQFSTVGNSVAVNMVHALDAAMHNAGYFNTDHKRARFAELLRKEDKRLFYVWMYHGANYTATERDTLNRLANKVRAESV